jgi:hypothetical protein
MGYGAAQLQLQPIVLGLEHPSFSRPCTTFHSKNGFALHAARFNRWGSSFMALRWLA